MVFKGQSWARYDANRYQF